MLGAGRLALFSANPVAGGGGGAVSGGYSYFVGGYNTSANYTRKYDLTGAGATTNAGALPQARFVAGGFGNGSSGFLCGGYNGTVKNTVYELDFSSDTSWSTQNTLPNSQRNQRGTSSSTIGYSWGGYRDGGGNATHAVNYQYTYSAGTWATGTNLSIANGASNYANSWSALHGNGSDAIHMGGGVDSGYGTQYTTQNLYEFSSDTQTFSNTVDRNHLLCGATGNQTEMVIVSGQGYTNVGGGTGSSSLKTWILTYNITSGAVVSTGTITGSSFSHADAAGDDSVGIWAGSSQSQSPSAYECAYTYSTDTYSLLSAYNSNYQVQSTRTESLTAFHSLQVS